MKIMHYRHRLLCSLLLLPLFIQSQQYNHLYDYGTDHFNSDNLCAEQIAEKYLVVGSSLEGPLASRNMQLSIVHSTFGVTYPPNYVYIVGGYPTRAVDLAHSTKDPDFVVTANNYLPNSLPLVGMNLFKVKPADGTIAWARHYGTNDTEYRAIAMAKSEKNGVHFVLGQYDYNYAGQYARYIYLLAIRDDGASLWERIYRGPSRSASLSSADLLYNPEQDEVVITGWISDNGHDNGALIAEIDAGNGAVNKAALIPEVGKETSFKIRDMVLLKDRYVIVGQLYTSPSRGFLLQVKPGLTPWSPFSFTYTRDEVDLSLSGIQLSPSGKLYASFDFQGKEGHPFPGLLEMDPNGKPLSSYLYRVDDYDGTCGLLDVFNGSLMVIKGSTGYGFGNQGALSLVSVKTPLTEDASICAERVGLDYYEGAKMVPLTLNEKELETVKETYVTVKEIETDVTDCNKEEVKGRLAAAGTPAPADETVFSIYPNPSQGKVTFEMNEEVFDRFRTAEVLNILGEVVLTFNLNNTRQQLDLSGKEPGIYFVRLRSADGTTGMQQRLLIY